MCAPHRERQVRITGSVPPSCWCFSSVFIFFVMKNEKLSTSFIDLCRSSSDEASASGGIFSGSGISPGGSSCDQYVIRGIREKLARIKHVRAAEEIEHVPRAAVLRLQVLLSPGFDLSELMRIELLPGRIERRGVILPGTARRDLAQRSTVERQSREKARRFVRRGGSQRQGADEAEQKNGP